jgi:hypothetical protein
MRDDMKVGKSKFWLINAINTGKFDVDGGAYLGGVLFYALFCVVVGTVAVMTNKVVGNGFIFPFLFSAQLFLLLGKAAIAGLIYSKRKEYNRRDEIKSYIASGLLMSSLSVSCVLAYMFFGGDMFGRYFSVSVAIQVGCASIAMALLVGVPVCMATSIKNQSLYDDALMRGDARV